MLDDRLTIFGGSDPVTHSHHSKVTTYNNATNSWYCHYPDMLKKRFRPGVTTYHNYVIVMGGVSTPATYHDNIEVMEYHNQLQWKQSFVHLPVPMWAIKPTISGDNIVIVGYNYAGGRSNEHYQISTDDIISSLDQPLFTGAVLTKWKRMLRATHYDTVTVPYSNPPLIIGGCSHSNQGSVRTSDVSLYDVSKNSWKKVESLTSARNCVGVGLINNKMLIVIGGTTSGVGVEAYESSALNTVEIGNIIPNHLCIQL